MLMALRVTIQLRSVETTLFLIYRALSETKSVLTPKKVPIFVFLHRLGVSHVMAKKNPRKTSNFWFTEPLNKVENVLEPPFKKKV